MNEVIQKALEGGFNADHHHDFILDFARYHNTYEPILAMPFFWQALGKAMGWKEIENDDFIIGSDIKARPFRKTPTSTLIDIEDGMRANEYEIRLRTIEKGIKKTWQYQMHRFIDHLIAGKDAESFFNELLK